jgi:hypothetical protein
MRDFSHFLWRCIETTVRPTWDTAAAVGVVTSVILAIILITHPEKQQSVTAVLSKILVLFLVIVFLTRLASSPYLVYRSRDHELTERDNTIKEQKKRIVELELNDDLGKFLKQQVAASQKGSLSHRATLLAQNLFEFVQQYEQDSYHDTTEQMAKPKPPTDEEGSVEFWKNAQKMTQKYSEFSKTFLQKCDGRVSAIADEFKDNGLTDPELDKYLSDPYRAAGALTFTIKNVAGALTRLAIKMEDKEREIGKPTPSAK